jgi:hypothetical protein
MQLERQSHSQTKYPQGIVIGIQGRVPDVLNIRCDSDFFPHLNPVEGFQRVLVIIMAIYVLAAVI